MRMKGLIFVFLVMFSIFAFTGSFVIGEISTRGKDNGNLKSYILVLRKNPETHIFAANKEIRTESELDDYRVSIYRSFKAFYKSEMDTIIREVTNRGGVVLRCIYSLGAVSVRVSESVIDELKREGLISFAIENLKVKIMLDIATKAIGADAFWGANITGGNYSDEIPGIEIAVVDTGVDPTDEYINSSIVASKSFVADEPDPSDNNGHGTLVASIIASNPYQLPAFN